MKRPQLPKLPSSWSAPDQRFNLFSPWALLLMVLVGALLAALIINTRPTMEHQPAIEQGVPVSTLPLKQYSVRPNVTGYGAVSPDVSLEMRAEVAGKVVFVHPQLKKGAILPEGTLVVRIEDNDYRLALQKARASLTQNQANMSDQQLDQQDAELDLQLAQDKLKLAQAELARHEKLFQKGTLAQSTVDTQRSSVLQIKQEVQSLTNKLAAMPYSTEVLKAQIEIAESEVRTQELNLQRTQIHLPFNARISSLSTETGQYVSQSSSLFSAQTIDKVQINAQFSLPQMRLLSKGFDLNAVAMQSLFEGGDKGEGLIERLGLSARVRLVGHDQEVTWNAKVERISNNLDPLSRTVGVIVSISNPYQQMKPGIKPPLIEGMYMQVELWGRPQPYLVVPRSALHEGELYLVNNQQKLKRMAVSGHPQNQVLLLDPAQFPLAGAILITSDPFPAVAGMQLTPTADSEAQQTMSRWLEAH